MKARPPVPAGAERRQSPALSGPEELGGRCGSCDCDPELLDPWLLAQWLRSLPYRHAEVFNQACSGRDTMRDHPWPGAWSASQYLVHVAQVAEVTAEGVVRLLADADAPPGLLGAALEAGSDCRLIEQQAAGMVAAELHISVGDALVRLRAYGFAQRPSTLRGCRRGRGPPAPIRSGQGAVSGEGRRPLGQARGDATLPRKLITVPQGHPRRCGHVGGW